MSADLASLRDSLLQQIAAAATLDALETVRVDALGKKGSITALFATMGSLPPDQRKDAGAQFNNIKQLVTDALQARKGVLEQAALQTQLQAEAIDVTLPPMAIHTGSMHPIRQVLDEVINIFARLGFDVATGPDIEDDWHNFTALNIPPSHPARQMHDTFYMQGNAADGAPLVLRTHTSPVQIRTLMQQKPPLRMLAFGSTYRCDSDQTHTPMFHQIEGLVIEEGIHMGHLKGTLQAFLKAFFNLDAVPMRLRPSFFPFTEPSAEVDIACNRQGGRMEIGTGDDWLEILGCGMVHPNVLKNCGVDPSRYQGFAFGMGVERLAMLKYGMPDLRAFFASDLRWLQHYGFNMLDAAPIPGGAA